MHQEHSVRHGSTALGATPEEERFKDLEASN